MPDIYSIIAIILLVIILILVVVFYLLNKKRPHTSDGKDNLAKLIEESRIKNIKDIQESVNSQNAEIQVLKEGITNSMAEAQKTNQISLHEFLGKTQEKLTQLQLNFTKESAEVKEQNLTNIKDLLSQTSKDINELKTKIVAEINESNLKNNLNINELNVKTQEKITSQIQILKEQVQKSLEQGFEKNEKAMHDFIEKTASIEASAKQMEDLRNEIARFRDMLSNPKARGNFGEGVLEQILISIFGSSASNHFYRKQVNLTKEFELKKRKDSSDVIVDFLFNITTKEGSLPLSIDAKFPYANYVPLLDENISEEERELAKKSFQKDLEKRIEEVTKYIFEGKTAPYAIMFIPSEAIFIDIFKEFPGVVEKARKSKVIIASPSLIITIIQILQFILRDYQIRNNTDEILILIENLNRQFDLFFRRWNDHAARVEKLVEDTRLINITTDNLNKVFTETKEMIDARASFDDESLENNID